jgi:hypothetical protein
MATSPIVQLPTIAGPAVAAPAAGTRVVPDTLRRAERAAGFSMVNYTPDITLAEARRRKPTWLRFASAVEDAWSRMLGQIRAA